MDKTYCYIGFEDPITGEKWDHGKPSLYGSLKEAHRCEEEAISDPITKHSRVLWEIHNDTMNADNTTIIHFTPNLTRADCEEMGNFDYPEDY